MAVFMVMSGTGVRGFTGLLVDFQLRHIALVSPGPGIRTMQSFLNQVNPFRPFSPPPLTLQIYTVSNCAGVGQSSL